MANRHLFPPGFHDIAVSALEKTFLDGFASSTTRRNLVENLRRYLEAKASIGIRFEVWIDGSFVTDKAEPNDVDLVVFGSAADLENVSAESEAALEMLFDNYSVRQSFKCDVYFAVAENNELRSYWRGWFGFDRDEQAKGIVRLWIVS